MLNFVNAILVNLSIIVSISLTLYFLSIRQSLKDSQLETDFINTSGMLSLTKTHQLILGIIVGILCFFISLNKIPVPLYKGISVDVRYLPIFFSIYYGSILIGITNGTTLIILKLIQYSLRGAFAYEYFNNIFLTLSLVILASIIKKQHLSQKRAVLIFLIVALTIRFITFSIIFYPIWQLDNFINSVVYMTIFSIVFLFTAWLIDSSISISKRVHIYRTASIYDHLTKLYNKESFYFFLDHAYNDLIMNQSSCGVAVIDIDNFKSINDKYGHLAGDQALTHVANLLTKNKTPIESPRICRIGGDEFAMVFKAPIDDPESYLKKKLSSIHHVEFSFNNQSIHINLSCGLAIINKDPYSESKISTDDLFTLADTALYDAKRNGKNQLIVTHHDI
ncbi:hypothetical protein BW731_03310 [Vagococcus martis]|uniref:GGDEF domain-containing protein n=1 Tax=Vagococcus martis TaxID=1768210 RepID=A0A1V4DFQ1_9ENTE|nr:GGDEF domain-containing protein [Vagococcus martis]OPF87305.1 hypothetical protein BW731_03310 [Vagococcus martis]